MRCTCVGYEGYVWRMGKGRARWGGGMSVKMSHALCLVVNDVKKVIGTREDWFQFYC